MAPRLRIPEEALELFVNVEPCRVVVTYQCAVRDCHHVYPILARDLAGAS